MANDALPAGINGGMTVYYTQQDFYSNGNKKITAFPKASTFEKERLFRAQILTRSSGFPNDRRKGYGHF